MKVAKIPPKALPVGTRVDSIRVGSCPAFTGTVALVRTNATGAPYYYVKRDDGTRWVRDHNEVSVVLEMKEAA